MWIIPVVLIVVILFYMFQDDIKDRSSKKHSELSCEEVLKRKFVDGELSEQEFKHKMSVIKGTDSNETDI